MTSQTGKQIITIYILPNISKSKHNQAMKFGSFIEYNMRNYFLEKSYTCGGEASPRPFHKKSKLSISLGQQPVFIVCPNRRLSKYIKTKMLTTCVYLIQSFLKKQKEVWN